MKRAGRKEKGGLSGMEEIGGRSLMRGERENSG
jgi:hypothetical protein